MEFRFSHREKFRDYMQSVIPEVTYQPEAVLLSVNALRKDKVETSYVHISRLGGFFTAEYESKQGTFHDGLYIPAEKIAKASIYERELATSLVLELTEQARDGEGVKLFVDFPKLSMIGWHNKNLKRLREVLGA